MWMTFSVSVRLSLFQPFLYVLGSFGSTVVSTFDISTLVCYNGELCRRQSLERVLSLTAKQMPFIKADVTHNGKERTVKEQGEQVWGDQFYLVSVS